MSEWSQEFTFAIICMAVSIILLLVLIAVLWAKVNGMHKKYMKMMNGSGVEQLPDLIAEMQQKLNDLAASDQKLSSNIHEIRERMAVLKGNVALHRFNAFNEAGRGSDLSFSVAFLDDEASGAVITAIHGRDETFVYGKPINKGESKYSLSPEEKQAVQSAMHSRRPQQV